MAGAVQEKNNLRCFKSHGESGDADHGAANTALPYLRRLSATYSLSNIYNSDEFGLWTSKPPRTTIGPHALTGRKNVKERLTFLACTNADGTDRLPPLVIGRAKNPRCFEGVSPRELGFDCELSTKAWMTTEIFKRWVQRLDLHIGKTYGRKALLFIDNAPCHNIEEMSASLRNLRVVFLSKNTTSILQPLDLGIIASTKKRYQHRLTERAVDVIEDFVVQNPYRVDLKQAVTWIYQIWQSLPSSIIYNCWEKSGII